MRSRSQWDNGFPGSKLISKFNDILDAAVLSVPVCGEDFEQSHMFLFFGEPHGVFINCGDRKRGVPYGL